ncbi:MAG: lmo0937 family membrane protein [Myxococcales bacterium]
MLWTVSIILILLWFLGLISGATLGWWVHALLAVALVTLVLAVVRGAARSA